VTTNVVPLTRKDPLPERSDDELMLLSAAGACEAFEELLRRYASRVLGFCVKSTVDRSFGEELAQEVWLSVWNHRAEYRPDGKFRIWLFTLAQNRLKNAARDRARRPWARADACVDGADCRDLSPSGIDHLIAAQRRARVDGAMSRIPANLRDAVVLRFDQELAYEEVAKVLGTSEPTARSRVFHGLRELRRRLRGDP
jgi:RNA polymerase sigma-70 factor, ECF subfamily